MNNENNNGFNQQPMNNQVPNPQPQPTMMPQQNVRPEISTQQAMNNSQFMNQSFNQQPMNNQIPNPQPQSTMMPQQSIQPQIGNNSNKKNKTLFLIIGVGVLILIAIIVLIIILTRGNSKGNTINEFEDTGIVENDNNTGSNASNEETISFRGFTIPKQNGYVYEIDTDGLSIVNNSFGTLVMVAKGTLNDYKSMQNNLVDEYNNLGYNPTNVKVSTYGGKEALTIEIDNSVEKGILYIIDAGSSYSFVGLAVNPSYTINYKDVETSVSLLSKAKYTNAYKIDNNKKIIEFKDLFK